MDILEWKWCKYVNIGNAKEPIWSKRLTYTYTIDLQQLNIEYLSEYFIEALLIDEAQKSSSDSTKFIFVSYEVKSVNRADDAIPYESTVRKLLASEIAAQQN
tara:strand:- start:302 stop:607 length:306 start_codon:yes stop_codon:yes gene_type:complete